jgi:hypothetical protein
MNSKRKIDAIYDLRRTAEEKARAEHAAAAFPSPEQRTRLLDAQLELEAKTLEAIEICHECGHEHAPGGPHIVAEGPDNVIHFSQKSDPKES